jgi:hypothetical protein
MNSYLEKKDMQADIDRKATLQVGPGGTLIIGANEGKKRIAVYLSDLNAREILRFLNHHYGAK